LLPLLTAPEWRDRAAVALAQQDQTAAVPVLTELLLSPDIELKLAAIHHLGRLGGEALVPRLCAMSADVRVRAEVYTALGRLAHRFRSRASVDCLLARAPLEEYDDARSRLAEALGDSGDLRAIGTLARLVAADPPTPNAARALIQLGAVQSGRIAGVIKPQALEPLRLRGLGQTAGRLIIRARAPELRRLEVSVNRQSVGTVEVDARARDHGLTLPAGLFRRGVNLVELSPTDAKIEIDHVIYLPSEVGG
jgi:HEAT repeat protein